MGSDCKRPADAFACACRDRAYEPACEYTVAVVDDPGPGNLEMVGSALPVAPSGGRGLVVPKLHSAIAQAWPRPRRPPRHHCPLRGAPPLPGQTPRVPLVVPTGYVFAALIGRVPRPRRSCALVAWAGGRGACSAYVFAAFVLSDRGASWCCGSARATLLARTSVCEDPAFCVLLRAHHCASLPPCVWSARRWSTSAARRLRTSRMWL